MTPLGLFLFKKSVNKAEVSRKTGLSPSRIGELTLNEKSHLRVNELCSIAKALDIDPRELLAVVCDLPPYEKD